MTFKDTGGTGSELPPLPSSRPGGPAQKLPPRSERARGTTNGNARGGSQDRRRRREWLVATYRADVDVIVLGTSMTPVIIPVNIGTERAQAACRCYRCGVLLTTESVTADRIVPGCQGGTYRRSNIRPACLACNSSTGATVRRKRVTR